MAENSVPNAPDITMVDVPAVRAPAADGENTSVYVEAAPGACELNVSEVNEIELPTALVIGAKNTPKTPRPSPKVTNETMRLLIKLRLRKDPIGSSTY